MSGATGADPEGDGRPTGRRPRRLRQGAALVVGGIAGAALWSGTLEPPSSGSTASRHDEPGDAREAPAAGPPAPPVPRGDASTGGLAAQESVAYERLVWAADFSGPAGSPPPADWVAETGAGWGDGELQAYTDRPANASLDGEGHLRITALREQHTDAQGRRAEYTSARLQTSEARVMTRLEARIRVPAGQGLWPAFWTLGEGIEEVGWPRSGEVDPMELVDGADILMANAHGSADGAGGRWQEPGLLVTPSLADEWHVYAVDWTPEGLEFSLDGNVYHRVSRTRPTGQEWPFDAPQHVLLNVAVTDTRQVMDSGLGPPTPQTPFPAEMLVDYVRAYG